LAHVAGRRQVGGGGGQRAHHVALLALSRRFAGRCGDDLIKAHGHRRKGKIQLHGVTADGDRPRNGLVSQSDDAHLIDARAHVGDPKSTIIGCRGSTRSTENLHLGRDQRVLGRRIDNPAAERALLRHGDDGCERPDDQEISRTPQSAGMP
jgi:hypothetical protein